jgi:hypothetical protein
MAHPNARFTLVILLVSNCHGQFVFVVLATRRDGGSTPVRYVLDPAHGASNQADISLLKAPLWKCEGIGEFHFDGLSIASLTVLKSSHPK